MTTLLDPSRTRSGPESAEPPARPPGPLRRLVRGPSEQAAYVRPAALAMLAGTAFLYLWNLTASGYANSFYAAAVQTGTQSWKAWLFGSLDAGNAITVDKPPAALWVATAFARLFGFNSFTVLAPQAFMGIAAVGLLYLTVKRISGPVAGLIAGTTLSLTPVAVLMFRFNNPDAFLVLLLVAAAYCVVRALDKASWKWLALAGVAVGFGFLTKMGQAMLVVPAFGLVYLIAAPTSVRKRLLHLVGALGAMIVSAGWYVALVELWPASSRPYIGGSTNNSLLELALGYNGLGRLLGGQGNGGGGGGSSTNTGFGGSTGITRMFNDAFGTEISWLLPAALIALVAGLWLTRRAPRTDRTRAGLVLWGGWMLVTAVVFSFMSGTIHPYYTVALAPAVAVLVAMGVRLAWQRRDELVARLSLAAMVLATGVWDYVLLTRTPSFVPWLKFVVLAAAVVAAGLALVGRRVRRVLPALVLALVVALGLGSTAYAVSTASQTHSGSIPTSGPSSSAMGGGGGMRGGAGGGNGGDPGGGMGGGAQTSSELTALLSKTTTTWAAAVSGSQSAASLELATGKSVIAIGGFSGTDDAPTLAQFKEWVAEGKIAYYISGGQGGGGGSSSAASEIQSWVEANYTATTVGSTTVYALTS
ncbi:4-amino-4-deoxy-L-arabinose transferase-like glycosyltransferase [Kribbella antiqua]|uniref:4-amino-4-deoxy-L-arabinose transferase-like glycosyltransferase n=1 Tax=Kribbella antiqua TaxID=2512217 RepID=A0A4R2IHE3_9ACTN|nr:glycosyltransferase family 39 protein [Kribbella antiqua]TCO43897.1 4-amino-4-deoxy-L-arabinose transferase-like glycosyltransferase [Kribbella antiqua]